jgi:lysophospholipase L1-like esterase
MNSHETVRKKIFYALFIVINLLVIDTVLSLFDPEEVFVKSFDKKYLFRMYPNKTGKVVSEEYSVTEKTNEFGFRQNSDEIENIDTMILGDSFTEGWGVEENEVYTSILNKNFGKKILNLGLHGSSPILYSILLPLYTEQFHPKKIIVQLFDNDLDDNEKLERFIELDKKGIPVGPKSRISATIFGELIYNYIKESTLYRLVQKIYKAIKKEPSPILYLKEGKEPKIKILSYDESRKKFGELKSLGKELNTKYGNQFGFYKDSSDPLWQERLKKNRIYLEQIVKIAKEKNIQISFLYIPAREYFAKNGITGEIKENNYKSFKQANPHELQIEAVCKENNLKCIFASEKFFDHDPETLYFPYDAHLNPKGHKKLAELIQSEL